MPVYFNLSLEFERENLYPDFMEDFFELLEQTGLLNFIKSSNQTKLEKDFQLGFTEHYSHDYKQVLYSFRGYSEVRGFWMHQYPCMKEGEVVSAEREIR